MANIRLIFCLIIGVSVTKTSSNQMLNGGKHFNSVILPCYFYKTKILEQVFSTFNCMLFSGSSTEEYTVIEDDIIVYEDGSDYQQEFLSAQKRRWPKTGNEVNIPFKKKSLYASEEKEMALQKAIDEFETKTCIR